LHPIQSKSTVGFRREVDAAHPIMHSHAAHGNEGVRDKFSYNNFELFDYFIFIRDVKNLLDLIMIINYV
jgi:hypothetical protein